MISKGFPYQSLPQARVLILGSLPGGESLLRRQYYALPQNGFWPIMGKVLSFDAKQLSYEARIEKLINKGIALWDVCATAYRKGSLDSAIQNVVPNDFAAFFALHRRIELVCFNGLKAQALYKRHILSEPGISSLPVEYRVLPSTSPAHAARSFDQKLQLWETALRQRLDAV